MEFGRLCQQKLQRILLKHNAVKTITFILTIGYHRTSYTILATYADNTAVHVSNKDPNKAAHDVQNQ